MCRVTLPSDRCGGFLPISMTKASIYLYNGIRDSYGAHKKKLCHIRAYGPPPTVLPRLYVAPHFLDWLLVDEGLVGHQDVVLLHARNLPQVLFILW